MIRDFFMLINISLCSEFKYDQKVETGTVCTVSLNMGWCDDMDPNISPTVGGTYVGEAHSGGASGEAKTPVTKPVVVIPDDDITFYNVKSPCLVKVIKNLMKDSFKNKINRLAASKFLVPEKAVNLDFNEIEEIRNEKGEVSHAETSPTFNVDSEGNTHVIVNLNTSTLPGTSELFQIITIYHETLHGIFKVHNGGAYITENNSLVYKKYSNMDRTEQHELLSSVDIIVNVVGAVSDIYGRPLQSAEESEIAAIVLYGASDAQATSNYQASMSKWNLNISKVAEVGEKNEKAVYDSNNKLLSIGGKQCSNE
ncbi:MAG TPA: hypothetical protein VIM75_00935 [Ohtaekwangia sp.]|uniref:hypothetical protein n=1 Tax=Ohtaekwangia sp. TaxID=2066019 RepID=UPI002F92C4A8